MYATVLHGYWPSNGAGQTVRFRSDAVSSFVSGPTVVRTLRLSVKPLCWPMRRVLDNFAELMVQSFGVLLIQSDGRLHVLARVELRETTVGPNTVEVNP